MSRIPRRPEHFPRMKHRAAGRAIRKKRREALADLDGFLAVMVALCRDAEAAFDAFAHAISDALNARGTTAAEDATEIRPD